MNEYMKAKIELFKDTQEISNNVKLLSLLEEEQMQELSNINQEMEKTRLYHLNVICQALGEDRKPLFKNEQSREFELSIRLEQDERYSKLRQKKKEIGMEFGRTKIEKEYNERNFKIMMKCLEV